MESDGKFILNRFMLGEQLSAPPFAELPGLFKGRDETMESDVLVKVWPRQQGIEDSDLEVIWRDEIRLLQRLAGYPGGRDYLMPILDAGSDSVNFYLILESRQRLPLGSCKDKSSEDVTDPEEQTARLLFWKNIHRLAKGLGILHANGLIHRNLGKSSIFTSGADIPDYQLGGFEWSIRLRSEGTRERTIVNVGDGAENYSFGRDWKNFGELVAKMLGVDPAQLSPGSNVEIDSLRLNVEERIFLRDLIYPSVVYQNRFDSDLAIDRINNILNGYKEKSETGHQKLYLAYNGDTQYSLWSSVFENQLYDRDEYIDVLRKDLSEATLLELRQPKPRPNQIVLVGRQYVYYLKKYGGWSEWKVSTLDRIESGKPYTKNIIRKLMLPLNKLEIKDLFYLEQNSKKLLSKAQQWDHIFVRNQEELYVNAESKLRYDSFVLLHLIECLNQSLIAWSVVVRRTNNIEKGGCEFTVAYKEDRNREKLSQALLLNSPVERLIEMLDKVQDDVGIGWQVTESDRTGNNDIPDKWTFVETVDERKGLFFRFVGPQAYSVGQTLYLKVVGDDGQNKLMRRRTQLLTTLKKYTELTEVLSSPLSSIRASHDPVPTLRSDLDASKQEAIKQIFKALPIYLLQGPPGVGKTHLVAELVNKCFSADPTARMLITAQGHDAINHLMSKICAEMESWEGSDKPLVVRSHGKQAKAIEGEFHICSQAKKLLQGVITSHLFSSAPEQLKQKIIDLRAKVASAEYDLRLPDNALESLLLRSANLVFSTTNSADLKRMIDSSAQFDWSIVEEAGRATGTELLAPLMLSHRRLLIGDPNQLPPYGEEKIRNLLSNPSKLQEAFSYGRQFLDRSLNDLGIDDLIDRYTDPQYVQCLTNEIGRSLLLFKSLYDETYQKKGMLPIAKRLDQQYRMHPDIAKVVSGIFYGNELLTSEKTRKERSNTLAPYKTICQRRLPNTPIVFIDMPWMKTIEGRGAGEQVPAYHNPAEIDAVVEILSLLRAEPAGEKPPSIAIITPYNQQVRLLSRRISLERKNRLSHLNQFDVGDELVHTINSFQGDEADIIIVSLVRNNGRSYFKGLGIVGDSKLMNVLLSRAKWKIVVVASLNFLRKRFPPTVEISRDNDLYFLKKLSKLTYIRYSSYKGKSNNRRAKNGISIVPYGVLKNMRAK